MQSSDWSTPGVGTKIGPTLCRADRLVGHVLGAVGALPDIYTDFSSDDCWEYRLKETRRERRCGCEGGEGGGEEGSGIDWGDQKAAKV